MQPLLIFQTFSRDLALCLHLSAKNARHPDNRGDRRWKTPHCSRKGNRGPCDITKVSQNSASQQTFFLILVGSSDTMLFQLGHHARTRFFFFLSPVPGVSSVTDPWVLLTRSQQRSAAGHFCAVAPVSVLLTWPQRKRKKTPTKTINLNKTNLNKILQQMLQDLVLVTAGKLNPVCGLMTIISRAWRTSAHNQEGSVDGGPPLAGLYLLSSFKIDPQTSSLPSSCP